MKKDDIYSKVKLFHKQPDSDIYSCLMDQSILSDFKRTAEISSLIQNK